MSLTLDAANVQIMVIKEMTEQDWPSVAKIYKEGIATGYATFELEVPDYEHWDNAHVSSCRLVALENQSITGWAALSPVSSAAGAGFPIRSSIWATAATGRI